MARYQKHTRKASYRIVELENKLKSSCSDSDARQIKHEINCARLSRFKRIVPRWVKGKHFPIGKVQPTAISEYAFRSSPDVYARLVKAGVASPMYYM